MSPTQLIVAIALAVILAVALATIISFRKRRTERLRDQFGVGEYAHAVKTGGNWRRAEADLGQRAARVESFHVEPLTSADQTRFEESWGKVQTRFVDSPASAVVEADQLLRDVMAMRGYPVSDFEQRAADISVDHPLVVKNYRMAHEIALRQTKGGPASTEELRQAMIHYRTLFRDLVSEQLAA